MELKSALIAGGASIATAVIAAVASIYASNRTLEKVTDHLTRFVYDNGKVTSSSIAGGKMVVVVNGSNNAGPVSRPLDMDRLVALCGDTDGCTITLGATRFRFSSPRNNYVAEAPLQGAPCRFFYTQSKHWSLSQACVAIYGLYQYSQQTRKYEFSRAYQVYEYGNTVGIDDSGGGEDPDGQPLIVLSFKGGCYVSESAPDVQRGGGHFLPDDPADVSGGRGLFLTASSPTWDHAGSYPKDDSGAPNAWPANDPARQCILIVED